MTEDAEQLRRFAATGDETAFRAHLPCTPAGLAGAVAKSALVGAAAAGPASRMAVWLEQLLWAKDHAPDARAS